MKAGVAQAEKVTSICRAWSWLVPAGELADPGGVELVGLDVGSHNDDGRGGHDGAIGGPILTSDTTAK